MEVTVEHLENHRAKMIVQVDEETIEAARRTAARRVARDLTIPGFRPGKAPYDVVLTYVGKETLTYEAIEDIGNDIYHKALDESKQEPYGTADITEVKTEGIVTLTFEFPKKPSVDLGDYRELRVEFTPPEVQEKDVDLSLARTRESLAIAELVERPAQFNDRVVVTIKGIFAKNQTQVGESIEAAAEAEAGSQESEDDKEEIFIDERQSNYLLLEDDNRDLIPGFSAQLIGMSTSDEKTFSLTFPDTEEDKDLAGRTVNFEVKVHEVYALTMPVLDDFMAELASDGNQPTLADLREELRKRLIEAQEEQANDAYTDKVLDQLAEKAHIEYPPEAVDVFLDEIMNDMDSFMQNQVGLRLTDYLRATKESMDKLRQQNRERAVERMRKTLILTALAEHEELKVNEELIEAEFSKLIQRFGGNQGESFRSYLESQGFRERIAANLITNRIRKRIADIAKGKNPPKGPDPEEVKTTSGDTESTSEASAVVENSAASVETDSLVEE